jgi:hypothetical protein
VQESPPRSSVAYKHQARADRLHRSVAYDYGPHNPRERHGPGAIRTCVSPPEGSELHQRQIGKPPAAPASPPKWHGRLLFASDAASYHRNAAVRRLVGDVTLGCPAFSAAQRSRYNSSAAIRAAALS